MNSSSNPSNVTSARPTVVTVLRHLDAVTLRHLRQRGQHRGNIELHQINGAEFLDDHIQIGKQRRVILRIGLRAGETQQTVGERGRILFGHREDHIFQHGAGLRVQPAGHAKVEQHDPPAAHHDVAGVRIRMEEAFVKTCVA